MKPGDDLSTLYQQYFPTAGPCAICDCGDNHPRTYDVIRSRWWHGESVYDLAQDYGLPEILVADIVNKSLEREGLTDEVIIEKGSVNDG